MINNC